MASGDRSEVLFCDTFVAFPHQDQSVECRASGSIIFERPVRACFVHVIPQGTVTPVNTLRLGLPFTTNL
jgi:hypothetical protein